MAKEKKWHKTFQELSTHYSVSVSALKFWSKQGHNLDDDALVTSLAIKWKQHHPTLTNKTTFTPRKLNLKLNDSLGLQGSLQRLREAERSIAKAYADAQTKGESTAYSLRNEWLELCEALRKAEKDSPEVAEANKKTVTVDELTATLNKLFIRLRTSLEGLPTRVTKELQQDVAVIVLNNIREEINTYINELYSCKFLEDTENDL